MATPLPATGQPLRLSWSRLREHEECSEKSWQHHVAKTRSPVADVRVYFRGTVVDRVMRKWLDQDDPVPGQMAAWVDQVLDAEEKTAKETGDGVVRWKHASDKDQVRAWCKELVTRLEPALYQHVIPYDYQPAVRFEHPLTIPGPGGQPFTILLIGEMDILVRWPDTRWVIWDLKGTEDNEYWRKVIGQLVFYEIAAFGMSGGNWPAGSGLLQPMCTERVVGPWEFGQVHRDEMFARIVSVAGAMILGQHSPKAGNSGCSRCFVRHACPKFAPVSGSKRVPIGS